MGLATPRGSCTRCIPNPRDFNPDQEVKVHTLDIAPLRNESPPQKRWDMARIFKGFHSFTCTPTRSSAIGMSHTCLCLPSCSGYSFADPRRDGRLSRPWCEVDQAEIRTRNLPIANPAFYHTATSARVWTQIRGCPRDSRQPQSSSSIYVFCWTPYPTSLI